MLPSVLSVFFACGPILYRTYGTKLFSSVSVFVLVTLVKQRPAGSEFNFGCTSRSDDLFQVSGTNAVK